MKRIIAVIVLAVFVVCMSGCECDLYDVFNLYPWNRSAVWYCEEIDATIEFYLDAVYSTKPGTVKFEQNGNSYSLEVHFREKAYAFSEKGDLCSSNVITGTWEYQKNFLVFHITQDLVFDNQFSDLAFVPQEM